MTPLTPRRVKLAFAVGIIADVLQLPVNLSFFSIGLATVFGEIPLEAIDLCLDIVAGVVINGLLGFHWALLPTFALELVPGLDAAPTWTACVAYVAYKRKDRIIRSAPSPAKLT
ncbi:MAG TPA: hypothetical protein VFA43_07720 [Gemmatimonadaceae bacterium]|nr:hypothetical protein [Gemmatimonadaceae bacterium]